MSKDQTFARSLHDLGLAAWFGGTLMGALAVNEAASKEGDPVVRTRIANAAWETWTPVNLAAIGAYVAGGLLITKGNKGRIAGQKGVAATSVAKAALTGVTLAATAYARTLGQKVIESDDAPSEAGTTPEDATPSEVADAQRKLKVLQWAIPAHVAALIVLTSKMGEQQRPQKVTSGIAARLARK